MATATRQEPIPSMVGAKIKEAMEKRGMSIDDLAVEARVSYEHARKMSNGEGIPSRHMLRTFCDILKLPFKEMENLATADRIRAKYGTIPLVLAGKKPRWERLERLDDHLTDADLEDAYAMLESRARRNRAGA